MVTEELQKVKLSSRLQVFCENFLANGFNGMQAVLAMPNNKLGQNSAKSTASQFLTDLNVKAYIDQRKKELLEQIGVTTYRVLQELAAIAFADVRDYYTESNALKNIKDLPANAAAALICIDVFEVYSPDGEKVGETKRIRMNDKLKALELLGRYLNMFEKDNKAAAPQVSVYDVTLNIK